MASTGSTPAANDRSPTLDHVVVLASSLDEAIATFRDLSGIDAEMGGGHPDFGTVNALASMGSSYLELIALTGGQEGGSSLNLIDFAMHSPDIDAQARRVHSIGLQVDWMNGQRRTAQGCLLKWRAFTISGHDFGGLLPFFIDWGETAHPTESLPATATDLRLVVSHPEARRLCSLYDELGLALPVLEAKAPRLQLDLSTPKGPISIHGDGRGWRAALLGARN